MEARSRLLQPDDENVTIRQNFTEHPSKGGDGGTALTAVGPAGFLPAGQQTRSRDAREPHRLGARATPEAIVYPAGDGELTGAALPAGKTPAPESGAGEEPGDA
jgi:hypothetical protein